MKIPLKRPLKGWEVPLHGGHERGVAQVEGWKNVSSEAETRSSTVKHKCSWRAVRKQDTEAAQQHCAQSVAACDESLGEGLAVGNNAHAWTLGTKVHCTSKNAHEMRCSVGPLFHEAKRRQLLEKGGLQPCRAESERKARTSSGRCWKQTVMWGLYSRCRARGCSLERCQDCGWETRWPISSW